MPPVDRCDQATSGTARRRLVLATLATALSLATGRDATPGRTADTVHARPFARGAIVTVYTPSVDWSAPPGLAIDAELRRAGRVVASAQAVADSDGGVALTLTAPDPGDAIIRPRDDVLLRASGDTAITLSVPALVVAPDVAAGRIVGRADGASGVTVTVAGGQAAPMHATPDGSGRFEVSVGAEALVPGGRGWAERAEQGHRFRAEWVVFNAAFELGTPWLSGEATPGGRISIHSVADGPRGATALTVVGDGTGAGRARFELGARSPLVPGATVVVTETLPLVPERAWRVTLPTLDTAIDAGARRVMGQAPAGAVVAVAVRGPGGEAMDQTVVAGDDGRYQATFPGLAIGPGWRASATVGGGGLGSRARAAIPQARVTLYDARVTGVGTPHGEATVRLRRAGQPPVGPWRAATEADGTFAVAMSTSIDGAAHPLDVMPGDVLLVDVAGGDPIAVEVPRLSAIADPNADRVAGEAPPGTRLRVTAARASDDPRDVIAAADGRWTASWSGDVDIAPGDDGLVVATVDGGNTVGLAWAAIGITVDLTTGVIEGNAPPNRAVTTTLTSADGAPLGGASVVADRTTGSSGWRTAIRDALGATVPLREGDRLALIVGDEPIALSVPPLTGVVHVADDLVSGRTRPGGHLAVRVARPEGAADAGLAAEVSIIADGSGGFAASFAAGAAAPLDVHFNDRVRLALDDGPHRFVRAIDAPGLVVDVGNGRVRGSLEPGVDAIVALERGGSVVASRGVRSGADATFHTTVRGPGESPPSPGDAVIVRADGAAVTTALRLEIVAHDLTLDAAAGAASGQGMPGAHLRLTTHHAFGRTPDGGPYDVIASPDGSWRWTGDAPLTPGTQVTVRTVLPSGHILERSDTAPILSVELGADRVCGRAAPLARVAISARDGQLSASGRADDDGGFALRLTAADGAPAILAPTDRVAATLGAEQVAAEPHAFHAAPDFSGRGIQGIAENTDWVDLFHPTDAQDCRGFAEGPFPAPRDAYAPFADGRFRFIQRELGPWLADGIELAWFDRVDGQRRFWRTRPLHVRLYIYTDRVAGTVAPGTELALSAVRVDGAPRGTATARGRPDGRFEARLVDADGQPIRLAIGDAVRIGGPDAATSLSLVVQRLDLDFATGTAIVGEAPASHPVDVRLFLADGRAIDLALTADETGGWSFAAADIPPRAGWSLGDIVGVRAELPLDGGHAVVVESGAVDGRPSGGEGRAIYLPYGDRP